MSSIRKDSDLSIAFTTEGMSETLERPQTDETQTVDAPHVGMTAMTRQAMIFYERTGSDELF